MSINVSSRNLAIQCQNQLHCSAMPRCESKQSYHNGPHGEGQNDVRVRSARTGRAPQYKSTEGLVLNICHGCHGSYLLLLLHVLYYSPTQY